MSEQENGGSPAPDAEASSIQESNEQSSVHGSPSSENTVKYESLLREKRRAASEKQRADMLAAENEHLKQSKLEAEGNLAESNERLKKQVEELSKSKKQLAGNFVKNSLVSQVEAVAAKLGCVDTEALGMLMSLENVEVDMETFRADPEELKAMIEGQKKDRPYLFNKQGPKLNTGNPSAEFNQKKKAVGDMTPEEQDALAKAIDKQEGKTLGWS
jgi:hypothetical protein